MGERGGVDTAVSDNPYDERAEIRIGSWRSPDDLDAILSRVWVTQNAYVTAGMVRDSSSTIDLQTIVDKESVSELSDEDFGAVHDLMGDAFVVAIVDMVERSIAALAYWRGMCSVEKREWQEERQPWFEEAVAQVDQASHERARRSEHEVPEGEVPS